MLSSFVKENFDEVVLIIVPSICTSRQKQCRPNRLDRNWRFLAPNLGPNSMESTEVKFVKTAKEHYFIQDSILL